jgi:hypothetical protein
MSTGSSSTGSASRKPGSPDNLAAARAARKAKAGTSATLSDSQKFAIGQARAASRVAKLVVKKLQGGDDVSPDVCEACGQLATAGGRELFS